MRLGVASTRCKLTDLLSPYPIAVLPIQNAVGILINPDSEIEQHRPVAMEEAREKIPLK
jgi:hypothetical protein